MALYKKKPIEVEAIRLIRDDKGIVRVNEWTEWWSKEVNARTVKDHISDDGYMDGFIIPTLEGDMLANIGDYIIRGIKGELYPCKPNIFEQTYELVRS